MEKKIYEFLKNNSLILDCPIVCAVSGGVDSVVLLHILNKLGFKVILAHVNHNKRLESKIEQEEMNKLAKKLNIPFELLDYHYTGNDNFHNEAHNARYNFFKDICKKYHTNVIATAHHLDDQLETILMKLLEGSNLYGYGGISICNDDGEYKIIRPLLCVAKEEIYEYAKYNNLIYFEDSSNKENVFLRNRIRNNIIPLLKNESQDLYNKVFEYSNQLKEAFDFIRRQSIDYLNTTNNTIDIDSFNSLDLALKKDIISLLLEKYKIRKTNDIINSILKMTNSNNGSKHLCLERDYIVIREYNQIFIKKIINKKIEEIELYINDVKIYDNKYKFYFSENMPQHNEKYIKLCYNTIEFPIIIRPFKEGDFITLSIGNKKLNRIFIDKKIPKLKRCEIPIITNNKNEIIWIYNLVKSKSCSEQKNIGDIYLVCEEL